MKKFFITLFSGVAIGILLAPAKGSVTRKKLVDRFNELTEDISDDADAIYQNSKDLLAEVKSDVKDLQKDVKDIIETVS